MLRTVARQAAQSAKQSTPFQPSSSTRPRSEYLLRMASLYPPKKVWPPDFSRLSPPEQLRFEKKYKRRMKLATACPGWVKFTKLAQLFGVTFFLVYAVLFMDWENQQHPFDPIRIKFWNILGQEYVPAKQVKVLRPLSDAPQARL